MYIDNLPKQLQSAIMQGFQPQNELFEEIIRLGELQIDQSPVDEWSPPHPSYYNTSNQLMDAWESAVRQFPALDGLSPIQSPSSAYGYALNVIEAFAIESPAM